MNAGQSNSAFHEKAPLPARPFLKWAGGKAQLLEQIAARLPAELASGQIERYVEPLIGGGAVFFHIAQTYPIERLIISDQNEEVILVYRTIRERVEELIERLSALERRFLALDGEARRACFYEIRAQFNNARSTIRSDRVNSTSVRRAAQLIFMNRTCFNGLFRVNARGEFNVPFGRYKNPTICDAENLRAVSGLLQRAEIHSGDFETCREFIHANTFVYFDPPYRPISKTASFNAYSKRIFDDAAQARLARFFRALDRTGAKLMLSNSDPHNENPGDSFFETLYQGFHIHKVRAKRPINRNGAKRGEITELLITNY